MKSLLKYAGLAAIAFQLVSCGEINDRLDDLQGQIDGLKSDQIATIDNQIKSINASVTSLESAKEAINAEISVLSDASDAFTVEIERLQSGHAALTERADSLASYVARLATDFVSWADATFCTLEQYEATCDTIAAVRQSITDLGGQVAKDLEGAISASEVSLKSWVNEQFAGYYTAAQMDAKLEALQKQFEALDKSNKGIDQKISGLSSSIESAKSSLTAAYRQAIADAVTAQGTINSANASAIKGATDAVNALTPRVSNLETEVITIKNRLSALEGMIQSVMAIPAYSDGSFAMANDSIELAYMVSPASAVANLTMADLTVYATQVLTKAVKMDVIEGCDSVNFDPATGIIELKAPLDGIEMESDHSLAVALNIKNGNSDFTTSFNTVIERDSFIGSWLYKNAPYVLTLNEDGSGTLNDFKAEWHQTSDTEGTVKITIFDTSYNGTIKLVQGNLQVVLPTSPLGSINWTLSRTFFVGTWYAEVPGEGLYILKIGAEDASLVGTGINGSWKSISETKATVSMSISGYDCTGTFELNSAHDQLFVSIPDMQFELTFTQEGPEPEVFHGTWYGEDEGSGSIRDNFTLILNDDGTGTYSDIKIWENNDIFYYVRWTEISNTKATIEFYESETATTPLKTSTLEIIGSLLKLKDGDFYVSLYRSDPKKDFEHLGTWYSYSQSTGHYDDATMVLKDDYTGTYAKEGVCELIVKWNKYSTGGALLDFYESEQSVTPVRSGKVIMWSGGFLKFYTADGEVEWFAPEKR